jgi:hypothetical protein
MENESGSPQSGSPQSDVNAPADEVPDEWREAWYEYTAED